MYKYTINTGDSFELKTPFCKNISDIKNIEILHTSEVIKRKSIYPNGFEILFTQYAEYVEIETNYPLVKKSDGYYYVNM